jgi:hypothetical protein
MDTVKLIDIGNRGSWGGLAPHSFAKIIGSLMPPLLLQRYI